MALISLYRMNLLAEYKFHFLMVLGNIGCAFSYFITNFAFNHGMRPPVYTVYRLAIGGCVLLPFAYVIERKRLPSLTAGLLCKICLLSLSGTSLPIITFFEGMRCTSPTVAAAVNNTIPCIVFVLAVILRLESLKIRSGRGMAKVAGSVLSLAGVTIMTIYKGQPLSRFKEAPLHMEDQAIQEEWIKGSILVVVSCLSFSFSYILQAKTLKKYPGQVSLAVWMNLIGAAMSAVYAAATTKLEPSAWALGFDVRLLAILYGGLSGSGFLIFVQLWCTKEKGAVFMTMFNPLTTFMSAFVAYFLVGSTLFLGRFVCIHHII
uniref:WAT1-related protein n=1 Tax=Kalanchoe fedtschenkoi TaxID=63787 RepID=A0A7N1A3B5_KALFE